MTTNPQAAKEQAWRTLSEAEVFAMRIKQLEMELEIQNIKDELKAKDLQINKLHDKLKQAAQNKGVAADSQRERNRLDEKHRKDGWISSSELLNLFPISKRSLQNYRNKRMIPFHRFGSKIFYKRHEVEEVLKSKGVKAFERSIKK